MKPAKSRLDLVLLLVLPLGWASVAHAEYEMVDGINWRFDISDGEAHLGTRSIDSSFTGAITIPSKLGGYPVTRIKQAAFGRCTGLTSVTIPSSVKTIDSTAFRYCSALTHVSIGNNVTYIGGGAFKGCSSLTSVTIPDRVTNIGSATFQGCSSLTSVTIPDRVTNIGSDAFQGCSSLTRVAIPDRVTNIGSRAFEDCSSLTNVTIGNSVTDIGGGAFLNCSSLTSITLPDSVTSLGRSAFSNCCTMTRVTILGNITNDWDFSFCPFGHCTNIATLVLDGMMTKIGSRMFYGCSGLTSVTIGNSVANIGPDAFHGCSSLTSVAIGNSVTSIGSHAFYACSGLTSVSIPDSVTNIGGCAFGYCNALTCVTIPDSVTSLGGYEFGASGLTSVSIGTGVANIVGTFNSCSGLMSVVIPGNVTNIGYNAFYGCSGLTNVTIPDSVTSIEGYAFSDCSGLTSVTIGDSVTNIGWYAFSNCSSLSNAWFKGAVPTVYYESPFAGVANGARGYYPAAYSSEWRAAITNGMWCGLIMEEAKAPTCELRVAQADPAAGSLTLAWQETTPVGGVTYSVYRSANDTYTTDDLVTNGLTGTSWTDTTYWSAEPVLKPLNYWVVADGGGYGERASNRVETRHRHGIFVGVGTFGPDYRDVAALSNAPVQASKMLELARGQEGFTDFHLLTNSEAGYAAVNRAFNTVAENVKDKPGDICVVYFSTHGGVYSNTTTVGSLVLYDKPPVADDPEGIGYHEGLLARHIRSLDPECKGVAVVCIISACRSGAFVDDSNEEMCSDLTSWCHKEDLGDNVAWITAANASSSSVGLFDAFMIEYGWKQGWAKKNSTQPWNAISFDDLGRYAIAMYNPIATNLGLSGCEKRNDDVLRNIVAGKITNPPNLSLVAPSSPHDVQASKNKSDCVTVTWQQGSGGQPDGYLVLRNRKDSDEYIGFEPASRSETSLNLPDAASQEHPMKYAVAAYNGAGVSVSDGFAEGWRTIQLYQATFYNELPEGYSWPHGDNTWVSPFMEDGQSLTHYLEEVTAKADAWKRIDGWSFIGWKNPAGAFVASKANGAWRYSSVIVHSDLEYHAAWTAMTQNWLDSHPPIASAANGDIATAATMTAANGCRTVGECYALGINPEDPNDNLRIAQFELQNGKPQLTLNHTADGSGKTFFPDVRVLGTTALGESPQWDDVTDIANPDAAGYRFFKASVALP